MNQASTLPPVDELLGRFVRLRPLTTADAEITFRWRRDARAALLNPGSGTPQEQASWIAQRPATEYNFIIEHHDRRPVGMVALVNVELGHRRAEPARFLIGEPDAVRGIPAAVEAMKLVYELAFDRLGLLRVHGILSAENRLMLKWQKYLGMKEEGRLRSHYFMNGTFQDAVCLGLLVDEYRNVTLPRLRALMAAPAPEDR
jgi:RimJ/RimL family protein N-acetyltransferase